MTAIPSHPHIRLLLTGGGTGGHLFPAVATAQKFQELRPETEVLFVGTKRKIDTETLASYGFGSESIVCYGLKGKKVFELLKALLVLPLSLLQALWIMLRYKPDVILGVGGYVTGPVVFAGKLMRIPSVIHEQNSIPGLANRKLGKVANKICLSLPGSEKFFPAHKISFTGNPVRQDILDLAKQPASGTGEVKTILVIGGSQGAKAVNTLVTEAIGSASEKFRDNIRIIHQTGDKDEQWVKRAYADNSIDAQVSSFFSAMHGVYASADLVISRAGATSLAEISVLGKPVILIPYPYAADNHQVRNGEYYVAGGGAVQFHESQLSAELLAETVVELLADAEKMVAMGKAMKKLSYPDAAERIVGCLLDEIKSRRDL